MHPKRLTVADYEALAIRQGIAYRGSNNPKSSVPENWECTNGHIWPSVYNNIKKKVCCPYCHGSSPKLNLQQSGRLAPILAAVNIELPEGYLGAKKRNRIRCLSCYATWKEFLIAILYQGQKCPVCVPRRGHNKYIAERLQITLPTIVCETV